MGNFNTPTAMLRSIWWHTFDKNIYQKKRTRKKGNLVIGNSLRRKKYPKGLMNWTLDTYQLKINLIYNLCDKCTIWYHNQNSKQLPRCRIYICTYARTRIILNHTPMIMVATLFSYYKHILLIQIRDQESITKGGNFY